MNLPLFSRLRVIVVIGLILGLVLASGGVATAQWMIKASTATPVAAGALSTELGGTVALANPEIVAGGFTDPVPLILHNPNPVPMSFDLTFDTRVDGLDPAEIELKLWEVPGPVCPSTVPATGVATGTLADGPALDAFMAPAESGIVLCAVTRFTGAAADRTDRSLTATPTLTASFGESEWTATATGTGFTQTLPARLSLLPEPVGHLRCTDVGDHPHNSGVVLSWLPVPGATSYEVRTASGQLLGSSLTSTIFLDETGHKPGSNHIFNLAVVARNAEGASDPIHQQVRLQQGSGMGNHLRCVN